MTDIESYAGKGDMICILFADWLFDAMKGFTLSSKDPSALYINCITFVAIGPPPSINLFVVNIRGRYTHEDRF